MDRLVDWLAILTPLISCILVYNTNKQAKSNKKYQEEVAKNKKLEKEKADTKEIKEEAFRQEIITSIKSLQTDVEELKKQTETIEDIQKQITNLKEIGGITFDYVQSVGGTVSSIGEEMIRSTKTDTSRLEKALEKHKHESGILNTKLYSYKC